jgi:orotate phosphoribosyltransferase
MSRRILARHLRSRSNGQRQGAGRLTLADLRQHVIEIVRERGLQRLPEPVALASGAYSQDFVDGKAALARGEDLELACRALLELIGFRRLDFDAVGGLTMGADQFAHVVAVLAKREWFVVRKEPKHRGTNRVVEGAAVSPGTRVLLVDDVVTTGGSIQKAYEAIKEQGATVVAAVTLVDRADTARLFFEEKAIPYYSLVSYDDLGIEPVRVRDFVDA